MADAPATIRQRALDAEAAGDVATARRLLAQLCAAYPNNAGLANTAGNVEMRAREFAAARDWFLQAVEAEPDALEYVLNLAIALSHLRQFDAGLRLLEPLAGTAQSSARYCAVRGALHYELRELYAASRWFDAALATEPTHAKALAGRARVALERAESDAVARFDTALARNPADPDGWLGKAQALEAVGDAEAARQLAEEIVRQGPNWLPGLTYLTQLNLASGMEDFTAPFASAVQQADAGVDIWVEWIAHLDRADRHLEALEAAKAGLAKHPDAPALLLAKSAQASAAGRMDEADAAFAALDDESVAAVFAKARHLMRRGEFIEAEVLLASAIAMKPGMVGAWAARDLCWRMLDDERAQWLHGQDGLVQLLPLEGDADVVHRAIPVLHQLHDVSCFPLGQSLRGGTQTRGILFDRTEPELRALHDALMATLETYRTNLPPRDDTHPLLSQRNLPWSIAGSWSIRLTGGGDYHTAHIHPEGLLSSALYCELPPAIQQQAGAASDSELQGALELGRAPPDLRMELEPLRVIRPRAGYLALFPSTLYHSTGPFDAGTRLTTAFDVRGASAR
ncbi:hypothetical protein HME9302_00472 [Alteripontixanthobacter maritimus]|uniref:Uncharacterized protein n=1 Tax=Alteripontixanthobacter maritimus TaxID=2161824 RepID=A0A369Q6W0_9SPHN|nr:tetratricopeptide repeat protein [Alteripontixanthobacter maritimus]RDC59285.1 hypothetical protein HME9302_00472 [Alteripontixanthobacter maritimus]